MLRSQINKGLLEKEERRKRREESEKQKPAPGFKSVVAKEEAFERCRYIKGDTFNDRLHNLLDIVLEGKKRSSIILN